MKVTAIIQARMGSTRLPGKVLMEVKGRTILEHVLFRIKKCKNIDDIIVATTTSYKDDALVQKIKDMNVKCFRGEEQDVLSRYYFAALKFNASNILRITSDCPLIDPFVTDDIVSFYKNNKYDLVSNVITRTYPRGLDTEVFSFESLEKAYKLADKSYEREHVTPYLYENDFKKYDYKNPADNSKFRWTLDTMEDFNFIKLIYENLYDKNKDFKMDDILRFLKENPWANNINKDVVQKSIKDITLREAKEKDIDILFKWANDEEVRKNSLNTNKISFSEHEKWFRRKMEDVNTHIYIIEINGEKAGVIRLEKKASATYISYSVDKAFRNMGIGKSALELIKKYNKNTILIGIVKKNNLPSIKAFIKAGFLEKEKDSYYEFIYGEDL